MGSNGKLGMLRKKKKHVSLRTMLLSSNIAIASYAREGRIHDARAAFDSLLRPDLVSWNSIISAYANSARLPQAMSLFNAMPLRNATSWNTLISAYSRHGQPRRAVALFCRMDVKPDRLSFLGALHACSRLVLLHLGKAVHVAIVENGLDADVLLGTALLRMYGKCGCPLDARRVFERMPEQDVVAWTALVTVYVENDQPASAIETLHMMELSVGAKMDKVAFIGALNACAKLKALNEGKLIHSKIIMNGYNSDALIGTTLIKMYGSCGKPCDSKCVFQTIHCLNTISWTAMITVYIENGFLDDAMSLFEQMPERDVIAWTAMIAGYAQYGHTHNALCLFWEMVLQGFKPDKVALVSTLDACSGMGSLKQGKVIHACIICEHFEAEVVVGTAVVGMYGKCGTLKDARAAFGRMPRRNLVSWNVMMRAYAQGGEGGGALALFQQMQCEGVIPDGFTFISLLSACGRSGLVEDGCACFESMHRTYSVMPTLDHYICMLDLLGRAGHIDKAEELLHTIPFEPPFWPHSLAWISFASACNQTSGNTERGAWAAEHVLELNSINATQQKKQSLPCFEVFGASGAN